MDEVVFVFTNWPSMDGAEEAGARLVEQGLAAGVNILPGMRSIYRWQGRVAQANETLMIVKTIAARVADVTAEIRRVHEYKEPSVAVISVTDGSESYLDWIRRESGRQ